LITLDSPCQIAVAKVIVRKSRRRSAKADAQQLLAFVKQGGNIFAQNVYWGCREADSGNRS